MFDGHDGAGTHFVAMGVGEEAVMVSLKKTGKDRGRR
jgi:hypothetical protein